MTDDPNRPEVLARFANDCEGASLVAALDAQGIKATATGGYTAGFRAEAPGEVNVVVRFADLDRAKQVLADYQRGNSEIDWSQVDVGDTNEP